MGPDVCGEDAGGDSASSLQFSFWRAKADPTFSLVTGLPFLLKQLLLASINHSQSWTSGQHNVREQLQLNAHEKDLLELSNTLTSFILSVARQDKDGGTVKVSQALRRAQNKAITDYAEGHRICN